jgi:hypothetical protein
MRMCGSSKRGQQKDTAGCLNMFNIDEIIIQSLVESIEIQLRRSH